jgi:hypothetical protein
MKYLTVGFLRRLAIAGITFAIPGAAWAASESFADRMRQGLGGTARQAGLDQSPTLVQIIGNIINVALSFLGVIMLLYFLYAGFLYLTSAGSKEKVTAAQGIMRTTIIGLLIVVCSYAIANFVLDQIANSVVRTG